LPITRVNIYNHLIVLKTFVCFTLSYSGRVVERIESQVGLCATMPSKKKKKQDFQKVKLKVGRKLPRPANETRTQFKVRGINIKSQFHAGHSAGVDSGEMSTAIVKVSTAVCLFL